MGEEGHSLLLQKGDGIKARHIPELLRFINEMEASKKYFIWGFEEPENSLDLEAAAAEAGNFANIAARPDTQIFISSHSPAFYLAESSRGRRAEIKRYFITKQMKEVVSGDVLPPDAVREIENLDDAEEAMANASLQHLPFLIRKWDEKNKTIQELKSRVDTLRNMFNSGKPIVFVEGASDELVLKKAFGTLEPQSSNLITFETKPTGAGVNFVVDMLSAWRSLHKHDKSKPKAVGIVDDDADDEQAAAKRSQDWNRVPGNLESAKCFMLKPPAIYLPLLGRGIKLPISLESYYPDEVWQAADKKGWLEPITWYKYFPDTYVTALLSGSAKIDDFVAPEMKLRVVKRFKQDKKYSQAQEISKWSSEVAAEGLKQFSPIVTEVLQYLS